MLRRNTLACLIGIATFALAIDACLAGSIIGRREGRFGGGVHESLIWAVGAGSNPTGSHGTALSWVGDYGIHGLPAGEYFVAGNAHGPAPHAILDTPVTVPPLASVEVNLQDRITMSTRGMTDLGDCQWAAQTFIATGRSLDEVVVISPDGGTQVTITCREGGPDGPQIGPSRTVTNGSLFPAGAYWAPDEVPLVPGRQYAIRISLSSSGPWAPTLGYLPNVYPNGHAWLDGQPIPEADLDVSIACRDSGFIDEYKVDNWWRPDQFTEIVQTFVPSGDQLRIAQLRLATEGGYIMQASVHEWNGSYPPGTQVGFAKHATMSRDLPQAWVWGPGEAWLNPGQTYALRIVRADGQPFAIYGDSDEYDQGQAYFDGVPDNGIDFNGGIITRERDRGDLLVSNLVFTPLSATEVRATFQTDAFTTATVAYNTGSEPFDTIWPADAGTSQSHDVIVRHLEPDTTYQMNVVAFNATRNVYQGTPVNVTTLNEFATLNGHVHTQRGPAANVEVILEDPGLTTFTDADGDFVFPSVPTGRHTLRVQEVGLAGATQTVDVTADGQAYVALTVTEYTNLLAGSDSNPIAGWTMYGDFNGEFDDGSYSVPARTGPKWMGYVANWPDMSAGEHGGGVYRTMAVDSGKTYRFGGFIQTRAFHDNPRDGLAVAHFGVDPTGGTDPDSPSVIWKRLRFTSGEWKEQFIDVDPQGAQITLFTHHKWEYFYETPVWFIAGYEDLWLGERRLGIPDFDRDNDVDLENFGHFQACLTGIGVPITDDNCRDADLDADDDVDADDFAIFSDCLSGADVPFDPDCPE